MTFKAMLLAPVALYGLLFALWVFYVAAMHVQKYLGQLNWFAKFNAYVLLLIGVVIDFVCNMVLTIPFVDPPREWLVTARLQRYHGESYAGTWRARWADWVCTHLLDQFDPDGDHC